MTPLLQVWAAKETDKRGFRNLPGSGQTADLAYFSILNFKDKMTKFRFLHLDEGRTWHLKIPRLQDSGCDGTVLSSKNTPYTQAAIELHILLHFHSATSVHSIS